MDVLLDEELERLHRTASKHPPGSYVHVAAYEVRALVEEVRLLRQTVAALEKGRALR